MTSLVEPVADLVPLKAIFLDVDGVLCCNDYAVLQPELLANLAMAIENTGAVVVVSSDWRLFPSKFTELCRALKHRNIRVIGKTKPSVTEGARPLEIIRFLTTFHAKMKRQSKPFRIMRWLAVDDRQLPTEEGGEYMTPNKFTVTDSNVGLTFNIAMEIINKLNRTVHPPAKVCQNGNLGIGDSSG